MDKQKILYNLLAPLMPLLVTIIVSFFDYSGKVWVHAINLIGIYLIVSAFKKTSNIEALKEQPFKFILNQLTTEKFFILVTVVLYMLLTVVDNLMRTLFTPPLIIGYVFVFIYNPFFIYTLAFALKGSPSFKRLRKKAPIINVLIRILIGMLYTLLIAAVYTYVMLALNFG